MIKKLLIEKLQNKIAELINYYQLILMQLFVYTFTKTKINVQ